MTGAPHRGADIPGTLLGDVHDAHLEWLGDDSGWLFRGEVLLDRGTGFPVWRSQRTTPSGIALVEKSATIGGSPSTGKPYAIGFVASRPSRPPAGATICQPSAARGELQSASAT